MGTAHRARLALAHDLLSTLRTCELVATRHGEVVLAPREADRAREDTANAGSIVDIVLWKRPPYVGDAERIVLRDLKTLV